MRTYGGDGLFAGLAEAVDRALGVSNFASKSTALTLSQRGLSEGATTLVQVLFDQLNGNWFSAIALPHSRSSENFRWEPQAYVAEHNPSLEVSLERALIGALLQAGRADWSNQMPLVSGIAGPHAFKRQAVDLVHKCNEGSFEFVELKIDSDTPVFAAIEILVYGLLWLLSRRDRKILGYVENPMLDAGSLRLSVLAPRGYYSQYSLGAFAQAINGGLHTLGQHNEVEMKFRFTTFPSSYYWSKDCSDPRRPCEAALIALLDSREAL